MLYVFLEIKAVVLNIQFLKVNNFINIDMFISYFLIIRESSFNMTRGGG